MAKEESEFQKLLSEAPAASSADTVTVMGALSRTADAARFVLTLPDGRSETLEVAAVKSAKKIAGAVGQSLVELELDTSRVSESLINSLNKSRADYTGGYADYQLGPGGKNPVLEVNNPYTRKEVIEVNPVEAYVPFVAAAPHQSHSHRAMAHIVKPPQLDPQTPPKQPAQDGTNPWQSLDITGLGGFDVITWHNGQAIYHY
jgi:hypothetical protein